MARPLAVILTAVILCAACGAKAVEQPSNSSAASVVTSSARSSMASSVPSDCGMVCGGDDYPALITTNLVTGTIGQPVAATWQTGLGTVTLNSANWAGPELLAQSDSMGGGRSGNGTYLVLAVTYECTTGVVPIRWPTWTAQDQGNADRWTPIDSYPPEALEARGTPLMQLEVPAGQRRDTTIVFDMQFAPAVKVVLADYDNAGISDVNLLATWTVSSDQGTIPAAAPPTG